MWAGGKFDEAVPQAHEPTGLSTREAREAGTHEAVRDCTLRLLPRALRAPQVGQVSWLLTLCSSQPSELAVDPVLLKLAK